MTKITLPETKTVEDVVKDLCNKASGSYDANEAMKFSQAALNVANAMAVLSVTTYRN